MSGQDKLAQLDAKISEARELLGELEAAAQDLREKKQHDAVDDLDHLVEDTELDVARFGPFKDEVMQEWRDFIQRIRSRLG